MITGAFVVLAGLGVTIATYALAWSGGVYIVAWGPMVYGFIRPRSEVDFRPFSIGR